MKLDIGYRGVFVDDYDNGRVLIPEGTFATVVSINAQSGCTQLLTDKGFEFAMPTHRVIEYITSKGVPPARSPAPPVAHWVKGTELRSVQFSHPIVVEHVDFAADQVKVKLAGGGSACTYSVSDAERFFEFVRFPDDSTATPQAHMEVSKWQVNDEVQCLATAAPLEAGKLYRVMRNEAYADGQGGMLTLWRKGIENIEVPWHQASVQLTWLRGRRSTVDCFPQANHEAACAKLKQIVVASGVPSGDCNLEPGPDLFALANDVIDLFQTTKPFTTTPGYERLTAVLQAAHDQAAKGKGADRHANGLPFHEQRMQSISHLLDSPDGMAYQVCKKVVEGLGLPTHERKVAELLGAVVYICGIVIFLEDKRGEPLDPGAL